MNDVCRKYNGDHTKPPKNITRKAWIFLDLRKVVYKPHVWFLSAPSHELYTSSWDWPVPLQWRIPWERIWSYSQKWTLFCTEEGQFEGIFSLAMTECTVVSSDTVPLLEHVSLFHVLWHSQLNILFSMKPFPAPSSSHPILVVARVPPRAHSLSVATHQLQLRGPQLPAQQEGEGRDWQTVERVPL